MRKLRITALLLLCLGLLIGGIGIGICLVEASSFTYGDTSSLNLTQTDTATMLFTLPEDGKLIGYVSWNTAIAPDGEVPQVKTDAKVEQGTVRVDVDYRAVPGCTMAIGAGYYGNYDDQNWRVHISPNAGTEAILEVKDQILADIKNRKTSEYTWAEVIGITFTVNPADRDKVDISLYE